MKRTSEDKFIAATLTGDFKEEYFEDPASPAASASTDETVEASDPGNDEDEISSANQAKTSIVSKGAKSVLCANSNRPTSIGYAVEKTPSVRASCVPQAFLSVEDFKGVQKPSISASTSHSQAISAGVNANAHESARIFVEDSGEATAAIEFRKDLVVHKYLERLDGDSTSGLSVKNFKRFKKKFDSSGNSFAALVPFAKEPYRESDFNKEVQEYVVQEKKRKEAEALAEELFHTEQLKRKKGVGASLVTALREGRLKIKS